MKLKLLKAVEYAIRRGKNLAESAGGHSELVT